MESRILFITAITKYKNTFLFSGICLFLSLLLILLSRNTEGFAQWYALNIYPFFPNSIGKALSSWEFSFFEAGIISLLFIILFAVIKGLLMYLRRNPSRKTYLYFCFRILLCSISGLVLIYTLTCSINYQRDGIGTIFRLPTEYASEEKLEKLILLLSEDISLLTDDPDWDHGLLALDDMAYINTEAVNSMKQLGKKDPSLSGYYPKPKPVYFSETLSDLGIEGVFSPFTMEANYNDKMTPFLIPYTICHELAHLKGYMKEEDAGFIAYLACKNSSSKIFQYSGAFHALTFALNALKSEVYSGAFNETYQNLPETLKLQLRYINEQGQRQEFSFHSMTKSFNNLYLIANAQMQGSKSYARMVDLLVADYAERISPENML